MKHGFYWFVIEDTRRIECELVVIGVEVLVLRGCRRRLFESTLAHSEPGVVHKHWCSLQFKSKNSYETATWCRK